jgi:hypothetical protein
MYDHFFSHWVVRVSYKQKEEVEKLIQTMLTDAVIRPSQSPYSSPAIPVKKNDGSWRLCIDYRDLNSQTIKNKFPIPVIEDLFDELCGANVFNKFELKSGYHQIRMREEDIHKTTFSTYFGHFEFTVMSFDLTNAPVTFQALMNKVFSPYLRKFVLIFFDDILVYSKSTEEHTDHLRQVLQTLREHSLIAKKTKCVFANSPVEYLGHIINGQGVATDPSKVETITNWPQPKYVTQLRSFFGLTRYYKRFILHYGLVCRSLHDLLKKDSFKYTPQHIIAFSTLKEKISNAPVLALPNFSLPFTLETDASGAGVGGVLMQQGRPLAFYNQALGPKASAQSIYHKEALAILLALKRWRHYFLRRSLIIKTDQQSLKHMMTQ